MWKKSFSELFLAVQDSSIGDLLSQSVSDWLIKWLIFWLDYNNYNDYRDSDLELDLDWELQ